MFPCFVGANFLDCFFGDIESRCDLKVCSSCRVYFENLSGCKFVAWVGFSESLALFAHHVVHVVLVSSCEQVIRIDARRVVAAMANDMTWLEDAFEKLVGDGVGVKFATV